MDAPERFIIASISAFRTLVSRPLLVLVMGITSNPRPVRYFLSLTPIKPLEPDTATLTF